MPKRLVYITHPIAGNIQANMTRIIGIVRKINTEPKYATVVPLVPYYADLLALDDKVPEERERGLNNGLETLKRKGFIDELWVFGHAVTEGMKGEIFAAFDSRIPVMAMEKHLYEPIKLLIEEWESQRKKSQ